MGKTKNIEWRQRSKEYTDADAVSQALAATTDTCVITHPLVRVTSALGAVTTFTIPNGEPGQLLIIISDHANDIDVSPTTATGWSGIDLDVVGDMAVLLYVDDTVGWVILSLMSVALDASPKYTAA